MYALLVLALALSAEATGTQTLPSGCPPAPTPFRRPGYNCNIQGYVRGPNHLKSFKSTSGDYTSCYDGCLADYTNCQSFAYNSTGNSCQTYRYTLNQRGLVPYNSSGIFFWNLKGCFKIYGPCTGGPVSVTTTSVVPIPTPDPFSGVNDGSFELYPNDNWDVSDGASVKCDSKAEDGKCHAVYKLSPEIGDTTVYFAQSLTGITPGAEYFLSYYLRTTVFQSTQGITCRFSADTGNDDFTQDIDSTSTSFKLLGPFTTIGVAQEQILQMSLSCISGPTIELWLDNVKITDSATKS